jgi:prepilin-type N-terminal cleavage/methylation domain-containing protein
LQLLPIYLVMKVSTPLDVAQVGGCFTRGRLGDRRHALTLVEVVVALAILGALSSGCYVGFNAINAYAVSSRLYSEAQTAAQNQIDLILSREPFDITAAYLSGTFSPSLNKIPVELMTTAELDALVASGVTFPSSPPTVKPATTDPYYPYYPYYREPGTGLLAKQAFIYQDPTTGAVLVTGTMTCTVVDAGLTMNFINTTNLNTRKTSVTVKYSFRNQDPVNTPYNYTMSLDTLRTADR